MSNLYGLIRKSSYLLVIHSFFLFFTVSIAQSSSAPESFADLAEKLSPSVVNISTTTVIAVSYTHLTLPTTPYV